jgi:hypothetical protein
MRFKSLLALSVVLVALCSSSARSIDDPIGKSVDQLIDESNGIYIHDINHPENPQQARMLWSREHGINNTLLRNQSGNFTIPEMSNVSAEIGKKNQYQTASSSNEAQTPSTQEVAASQSVSVAGNWSFRLRDSKNRVLALRLFQSKNVLFGKGTINDGGDTLAISASGSVDGDKLNLDATSSGTITLYRLVLMTDRNSASGEYWAFSAGREPWIGLAEGMRID